MSTYYVVRYCSGTRVQSSEPNRDSPYLHGAYIIVDTQH